MNRGEIMLGVVGWAGVTILALIWSVYYEKIEPLS
jgi:hypothetical protein